MKRRKNMAKGETSTSEEKVLEKVAAIERKLDELKATTRTSIWVGRLVLIVIAVVIIIQVLSVVNIFKEAGKNQQAYINAAQEEFNRLLPKIGEEGGRLAEKLAPVYEQALIKEFDEGMPEIAEMFTREFDTLIKNVSDFVNKSLETKFDRVLEKQLEILAKDMPELKDDAKRKEIMEGVVLACHTASVRMAEELFKPQIDALFDLNATIESAAIPESIQKMSDTQLVHYTTQRLGDLLLLKMVILEDVFGEEAKAVQAEPPAAREKPKPVAPVKKETPKKETPKEEKPKVEQPKVEKLREGRPTKPDTDQTGKD